MGKQYIGTSYLRVGNLLLLMKQLKDYLFIQGILQGCAINIIDGIKIFCDLTSVF